MAILALTTGCTADDEPGVPAGGSVARPGPGSGADAVAGAGGSEGNVGDSGPRGSGDSGAARDDAGDADDADDGEGGRGGGRRDGGGGGDGGEGYGGDGGGGDGDGDGGDGGSVVDGGGGDGAPTPPVPSDGDFGLIDLGEVDDHGWSVLEPPNDAVVVYVSSSEGSDGNDGRSPDSPKATLQAGYALLRTGEGDQLLLRRGDVFQTDGIGLMITKSGASTSERLVVGAYGVGARPVIAAAGDGIHISPGFRSPNTVRHVAVVGLEFYGRSRDFTQPGYDPSLAGTGILVTGVQTTAPVLAEDLLIEDCAFRYMQEGVVATSYDNPMGVRNLRIRRSVFLDTYKVGAHTNAVYASDVHGLLLDEIVVIGVNRAPVAGVEDTSLSHPVYIQVTNSGAIVRRSVFARAFDAAMMRSGGIFEDNFAIDVQLGNHQGYIWGGADPIAGGVSAEVRNNVFALLHTAATGIVLGNVRDAVVAGNLVLPARNAVGYGIQLLAQAGDLGNSGVHDTVVEGNLTLGGAGLVAQGDLASNVTVQDNRFHALGRVATLGGAVSAYTFADNTYYSEASASTWFGTGGGVTNLAGWTDFTGEIGATAAAVVDAATLASLADPDGFIVNGTDDVEAFLAGARAQRRGRYEARYTAAAAIDYFQGLLAP